MTRRNLFDQSLQLPTDELAWEFAAPGQLGPAEIDFLINPRRLRGSDFLMRWAQGRWSEEIVVRAMNQTSQVGVLPYGPSTIAPEDPKALEIFFEKMDAIAGEGKRPDLLLYDRTTFEWAQHELAQRLGGAEKMAETPTSVVHDIVAKARAALEIENSLWVTEKMPGFGKPFLRYVRGRRKGRSKAPGIVPTVIVKGEDIPRLKAWETRYKIPIYVIQIFYDRGYFIKFSEILALLKSGELEMETQRYSNPDGVAATPKQIVKVPYVLCKEFGTVSGPSLAPKTFVDKNGKVMTYVTFSGGEIHLSHDVLDEWGVGSPKVGRTTG